MPGCEKSPVIDSIRQQLQAAGIKTVYQTTYAPNTTDFDTIVSKIKSSGADLVAEGAVFDDGVGMVRSMIREGYNPKILFETSAPSEGSQFSKGVGKQNTAGIFYAVSWSPDANYSDNQKFVAAYKKRFGGVPPEDAADAFATAQVLQQAVEAVGSTDQKKIADWLHSNSADTILGKLSWNSKGEPQQAFILAQWQNGSSEVVLPKDVATSDHIVNPKPAWHG